MRKALGFFILSAFIGISIFGFMGIHCDDGQCQNDCLASAEGQTSCPAQTNMLSFISFHLNALKRFSVATFDVTDFILSVFLLIAVSFLLYRRHIHYRNSIQTSRRHEHKTHTAFLVPHPFLLWLAILRQSEDPIQTR
jgi:hypothetical protein